MPRPKLWTDPASRYPDDSLVLKGVTKARKALWDSISLKGIPSYNMFGYMVRDDKIIKRDGACHYLFHFIYQGDPFDEKIDEFVTGAHVFTDSQCQEIETFRRAPSLQSLEAMMLSDHFDCRALRAWYTYLTTDEVLKMGFWPVSELSDVFKFGLVVNADAPQAPTMAAVIGTRQPKENPQHVRLWYHLVEQGLSYREAMCYMSGAYREHGYWIYSPYGDHHGLFDSGNVTRRDIRNIDKGIHIRVDDKKTIREIGYTGVQDFWLRYKGVPWMEGKDLLEADRVETRERPSFFDTEPKIERIQSWDSLESLAKSIAKLHKEGTTWTS